MSEMYKMYFPELPYYLEVYQKVDDDDSVHVIVKSKIHVNKEVTLPTTYNTGYIKARPNSFRGEILAAIIKRYGLHKEPTKYL